MPAPKGNKNANKSTEDIQELIRLYITHISNGLSKKSFIECDYRTIESHIKKNVVLHPLKKELERAEREGMKYWDQLGKDLASGKSRGNPAIWIFTMKNKYPEDYRDKQEIEHSGPLSIKVIYEGTDSKTPEASS